MGKNEFTQVLGENFSLLFPRKIRKAIMGVTKLLVEAFMQKQPQWKDRFSEIVQVCQEELKRTTEIGKKMLSASKTNTALHESYEELGHLAFIALESGDLNWDSERAKELVNSIKSCECDLENIEKDVNEIKKCPK